MHGFLVAPKDSKLCRLCHMHDMHACDEPRAASPAALTNRLSFSQVSTHENYSILEILSLIILRSKFKPIYMENVATGGISPTLLATMNQLVKKKVKEGMTKLSWN
jgi:hypothetical protein